MSEAGLTEIFLAARNLPAAERARYLEQACGPRKELLRELEALLQHEHEAARLLPDDAPDHHYRSLFEEALEPGPPRQLGPFRIHGILGRGGMGIVYRSEQPGTSRPIALKVLRTELLDTASMRRFEQEVEILRRLRHPGIAQIYEAGTVTTDLGQLPYIAMELVEGVSLQDAVRPMDLRARVGLLIRICEAVHHANQCGVLHRDLKPANILVAPDGVPYVLDFGVSRMLERETVLTLTGQRIGTLPYMSPEQLDGRRQLDARTDVYSLGVCAFEVLSGRLPFLLEGCSVTDVIRAKDAPFLLSAFLPEARGGLEAILWRAMASRVEDRPSTPAELAAQLRRWLAGQPIRLRIPSAFQRTWRRHWKLALTTALLPAAIGLGGTLFTSFGAEDAEVLEYLRKTEQIDRMRREASRLWPHAAFREELFEAWTREALGLVQELPALEARLAALGAELSSDSASAERQEALEKLLGELRVLADSDPNRGLLAQVRAREEAARGFRAELSGEHEEAWTDCLRAIAASQRYGDLSLDVQRGLVPLRADPRSGLWEFWHVASGQRPELDPVRDSWSIQADTGIVLILVPGGTFLMGAQKDSPDAPNYEPYRIPWCEPVHEIRLDPFFLSKYEMTQAQWLRLTGENPSRWQHDGEPGFGTHPVEQIAQDEGAPLYLEWELVVPAETWFEYAARAGTTGVWFGGSDYASLDDLGTYANIKDRSYARTIDADDVIAPWDDGFPDHAPVGSFAPNPWGFHDILGNVMEWTEGLISYEQPLREFGYRSIPPDPDPRVVLRGGGYSSNVGTVGSAFRAPVNPAFRAPHAGFRPGRRVEPMDAYPPSEGSR